MRRALLLLALVTAGTVAGGLAIPTTALSVGGRSVSEVRFAAELRAIASSPSYSCYLQARIFDQTQGTSRAPVSVGATSRSWSTGLADEWSDLRAASLANEGYVATHVPGAFSPAALATAARQLATAIGDEDATAAQHGATSTCGTTAASSGPAAEGAATLASLPGWFRDELVRSEAAVLGLAKVVPQLATTGPGLRAWFTAHASSFDTLCISAVAVTTQQQALSVQRKIDAGMSFATAAARYTATALASAYHKSTGGALGCFAPNTATWPVAVRYLGNLAVGAATVLEQQDPTTGSIFFIVLGPTARRPSSYAVAMGAASQAAASQNLLRVEQFANALQNRSHVVVSPLYGTWTAETGGAIQPPASPPAAAVLNPSADAAS